MTTKTKRAKVYVSLFEKHLSTARSGNPWTKRGRGAVRWSEHDYALWENGEVVHIKGQLVPGGIREDEAREFVATGNLPVRSGSKL